MLRRLALASAALLLTAQSDVKDHPLVSRYQGSQVMEHKVIEYDEVPLPLGPIIDANTFVKMQRVQGKVTKFRYTTPTNRSVLEVFKNYQDELQRNGFQILYTCAGNECKSDKFTYGYEQTATGIWCFTCQEPIRFLAAKVTRPGAEAYVAVLVSKDPYEGGTWLTIVEPKAMTTRMVAVNAAALANDIAQSGHATIYGVYFDTGKAIVKPQSDATLAEIAKLLAAHPQLKLFVVGHTDDVGGLAPNMTLSKERAAAVVSALVTRYHVAAARLLADGVGPLAPIATNHSEEGRARNRRVELVEQ